MTTLSPATPQYSVVGKSTMSTMRYDGEPIYYVVMDPVNLTNDGFKENVKLIRPCAGENGRRSRLFSKGL
jgi:hypothetical protein